jgi:orotidine-5'-phosphate decarboxylase
VSPVSPGARPGSETGYLDRLARRVEATGGVLCVGLDPDPAALPRGFPAGVAGVERFAALVVEATLPHAAAFKPNLAFWEALGPEGLAALERVRAAIPPSVPVVADAKRGDIGSTAARQAVALVERLGADAVTVSPYLGRDAVTPFLDAGAFAYVLCRTSNPSAGELQDLPLGGAAGEPLHLRVARLAGSWDATGERIGLVVGATAPAELAAVRAAAPGAPFLVPGVGAQGGSVDAALEHGPARQAPVAARAGGGLLVNVSRAIADAPRGEGVEPGAALAAAARSWSARLRVLDSGPEPSGGGRS